MKAFFVTIPHSGEKVPAECNWLEGLAETTLMCDVDRFVDRLYEPSLQQLRIPVVKTEWHRYAADLNRIPEDVDRDSVVGSQNPSGMHSRGFHWVITTHQEILMKAPMTEVLHNNLIRKVYEPFHNQVRSQYESWKQRGFKNVYHLDAHSMPSLGTDQHRDPGHQRPDIVVSDCKGKSCDPEFVDLVLAAYAKAGFKVAYNWPYFGGRVSEVYGQPNLGQQALQVELNRSLYMNEETKHWDPKGAQQVQKQIHSALEYVLKRLSSQASPEL